MAAAPLVVSVPENDYAEALDEMRDHLDTEYDSVALDDDEVEDDFEDDEEDLDDELEEDELTEEDER